MSVVESMAGSGKEYLVAQVREKNGRAHFQVPLNEEVNREYGWAFNLPLDGFAPITALKLAGTETEYSLAGTDQQYIPCQIRPYPGGKLHVQVESDAAIGASPARRPYGVAVNLNASKEVVATAAELLGLF